MSQAAAKVRRRHRRLHRHRLRAGQGMRRAWLRSAHRGRGAIRDRKAAEILRAFGVEVTHQGRPRRQPKASTSYTRREGALGRLLAGQCRPRPRQRIPRSGLQRHPPRHRHQRHRHRLSDSEDGRRHARRGEGKILITGSIAGFMPGTYQAVYNGTKAFLDSFSFALRAELKDTWRHRDLPDAGRDRDRILRARRHARHQGRAAEEGRSAEVAKAGFDAMMDGKGDVVTGWQNKLHSAIANVTPAGMLAEQHRAMAEPGSARR